MINDDVIKARVEARERAALLLELAAMSANESPTEDAKLAFWAAVRICATKFAPLPVSERKQPVIEPMSDEESRRFEQKVMPFGMHAGLTIGCLAEYHPDYLQYIAGDVRFVIDLNRYLLNSSVARDVQASADDDDGVQT